MEYDIPDKHAFVFIVISKRLSSESLCSLMRLFGIKSDEWDRICRSQCPPLAFLCYLHKIDLLDKTLLEKHLKSIGEVALSRWLMDNWNRTDQPVPETKRDEAHLYENREFTGLDSIFSSEVFTPGDALQNRLFMNGIIEQQLQMQRKSSSRTFVWPASSSSSDSRKTPISLPEARFPDLTFDYRSNPTSCLAKHRGIHARFDRTNKILRTQSQTDLYTSVGRKKSLPSKQQLSNCYGGFSEIYLSLQSSRDINKAIGIYFLQEKLQEEFNEAICFSVWDNIKHLFSSENQQLKLFFLDFFRSFLKASVGYFQETPNNLEEILLFLFRELSSAYGAAKFKTYRILDELIQEFPALMLLISLTRVILRLMERSPEEAKLLILSQEVYSDFLTLLSLEDLVSIPEINVLARKCVNQSRSNDPLLQKIAQQIIVNFYNLQPTLIFTLIRDLMDYDDKRFVSKILQGHLLEEDISMAIPRKKTDNKQPPPLPPRPIISPDKSKSFSDEGYSNGLEDVSDEKVPGDDSSLDNFILEELKELDLKSNNFEDISMKIPLPGKLTAMRSFLAPATPIISNSIISHEDTKFVSLVSKRDPKRYFSKRVFVFLRSRLVAGILRAIFKEECATEFLLFPAKRNCIAGVEFTHTVGDCDGTYKGKRRFFCRANCAIFLSLEGVFVLRD